MKVLFITNIPSPYRVEFFNELGRFCDLTVLYERSNATNRDNSWFNNKALTFNETYLNGIRIGNDSAISFSVVKWLSDNKYDVIVVGGYSTPTGMLSIEYLSHNNIPFILNSDGGMVKTERNLKYVMKKHFISKASAWLSTSKITDKYLLHYGASKDRIYRYPFTSICNNDLLVCPLANDEKLKIRRQLNINAKKMILTVGQFIHRKGFDILLKSHQYNSEDIALVLIGGSPTDEYKEIIRSNNLKNVYFIEFKTKPILANYYKAADLFVLPTREDIWGLVINEAMCYGLPVITTDKCVAGVELVEDNTNGYIIPNEDIYALSNAIKKILSDEALSESMARANIEKIKEYTIEAMAQRHIQIFSEVFKKESMNC